MNGNKDEWIIKLNERINVLTAHIDDSDLLITVLKTEIGLLEHRVNNLEVLVDNLRVEYNQHAHTAPSSNPDHPLIAKPGHKENP